MRINPDSMHTEMSSVDRPLRYEGSLEVKISIF